MKDLVIKETYEFSVAGWVRATRTSLLRLLSDGRRLSGSVAIQPIRQTKTCLIFRLKFDDRVFVVKAFDPYSSETGPSLNEFSPAECDFLKSLPIRQKKIAKNDAHLSNFVLRSDGTLIGFDFECATFKPVGWDILVVARSLVKTCPAQSSQIIDALVNAWGQGTDEIGQGSFHRLVRLFVKNTAFHSMV